MRELHYAGESVFASYDVCDAVFNYARALANANLSDVVTIPILIDGKREFSKMLLGPASSLFCTPGPDSDVDLEDDEALAYMKQRTLALGPNRATAAPATGEHSPNFGEYDHL